MSERARISPQLREKHIVFLHRIRQKQRRQQQQKIAQTPKKQTRFAVGVLFTFGFGGSALWFAVDLIGAMPEASKSVFLMFSCLVLASIAAVLAASQSS